MGARSAHAFTDVLRFPEHVLEHRALLTLPGGEPISEVVETYASEIFAFPQPAEER